MSTLFWIIALATVGLLAWNLAGRLRSDQLEVFNERRRDSSLLVSRGEFVDGNRRLKVALALTESSIIYESQGMQASLGLEWIREIEYDTVLATGLPIDGGRVLRLRSHSQVFEFVLPVEAVSRWCATLPARQARNGSVLQVSSLATET